MAVGCATFLLLFLSYSATWPYIALSSVVHLTGNSTVPNGTLEYYLCEGNAHSNLTLTLTSDHHVSAGLFCLTQSVTDLTITSIGNRQYTVYCHNSTSSDRRGFGFYNVTNLQITNVIFKDCGGTISEEAVRHVNNTQFLYFGPGQKAAILFNHCLDVKLENMSVLGYWGFGIVGANLEGNAEFTDVSVAYSHVVLMCNTFTESGGGILLFYQDSDIILSQSHSLNAVINRNYSRGNCNCAARSVVHLLHQGVSSMPAISASGLTMIFSQEDYSVQANIWCQFTEGGGTQTGTIIVLFSNDIAASQSQVVFDGVSLSDNSAQELIHGLEMAIFFYSNGNRNSNTIPASSPLYPVIIRNAAFKRYQGVLPRSNTVQASLFTILLSPQNETKYFVDVTNLTFEGNQLLATTEMILFYSQTIREEEHQNAELHITIRNVSAHCNVNSTGLCVTPPFTNAYSRAVLFSFVNLARVTIHGIANFSRNAAGSILYSYSTDLYLSGSMTFEDGSAVYGAAIRLQGDSHIFLQEPLHATFSRNQATQGGAIYGLNAGDDLCILQFIPQRVYDNITSLNIRLNFTQNSAVIVGNSIYTGPIYDCAQVYSQRLNVRPENYSLLYKQVFQFDEGGTEISTGQQLSSFPVKACMCESNGTVSGCSSPLSNSKETYPGRHLHFYIAVNDATDNPVYCTVIATISTNPGQEGFPPVRWRLGEAELIVQLQSNHCSVLNYTLFNLTEVETISENERTVNIEMVIQPNVVGVRLVELKILDCPPGFVVTQQNICNCIPLLTSLQITCDINTGLVSRPKDSWIGIVEHSSDNTSIIGFSSSCPPGYCNPNRTQVNISDPAMICNEQRTGILCSQCQSDLSIVFGSDSCQKCSNAWVSSIILYAAAGIILVALLFSLRMTVANGIINGLIFYGNITVLNVESFVGPTIILKNFLSFINLELGFPLCFTNGMNTLWKTGLQFVFPVYLWGLVILLIVLSRWSIKMSNLVSKSSVQVLATLFYLSYSKLLSTVLYILTFTTIQRGDKTDSHLSSITVWYYDGSVEFASGGHVVLLLLALLIAIFLLLPYTILLTGVSFFMKYRWVNRFKPLIDAYHGPYKDKWRLWFGVRLWILLLMFSIQAGLGGSNVPLAFLLHLLILGVFLLVQASIKPFRNIFVGLLDIFFMANYCILAAIGTYFLLQDNQLLPLQIVAGILVGLAFLVFLGIAAYHPVCAIQKKWLERRQELKIQQPQKSNVGAFSPAEQERTVTYELYTDEVTDEVIFRSTDPAHAGNEMYESNRFRDSVLETLDN